jgi:hypothetical protein
MVKATSGLPHSVSSRHLVAVEDAALRIPMQLDRLPVVAQRRQPVAQLLRHAVAAQRLHHPQDRQTHTSPSIPGADNSFCGSARLDSPAHLTARQT